MSIDGNKIMNVAAAKILYDDLRQRIDDKLENDLKGAANGLAELDANGKVPYSQLPTPDSTPTSNSTNFITSDGVYDALLLKSDKVNNAVGGNFAGLDANGNLIDSGHKHSDYLTQHQDISGKTDKVANAVNGNFASLDANGNLIDSGHKHSDYLTQHQDISGKQDVLTFDSTPTQNSTNPITSGGVYTAIENINTMAVHICGVSEYNSETGIPTVVNPDPETFYLVPGGSGNNLYIEWVYVNNAWQQFGSATIDLTPYTLSSSLATVATSGNYSDLIGKPTIPINVSDLQNDAGYLTQHQSLSGYVRNTDYATQETGGVVKVLSGGGGGFQIDQGFLLTSPATYEQVKSGTNSTLAPLVPAHTAHTAFYGLAKAAGDTTQALSENTVGVYTNDAKAAIQGMLGVMPSNTFIPAKVSDLQNDAGYLTSHQDISGKADKVSSPTTGNFAALDANGNLTDSGHKHSDYLTSHQSLSDYVQKTDYATDSAAGVVKVLAANGVRLDSNNRLLINRAGSTTIKTGTSDVLPITPGFQHEATFYGLAKAAGDSTQASSDNAVGTYTNDAKTAIRSMLDVPSTALATASTAGVVKVDGTNQGIAINNDGKLILATTTEEVFKAGTSYIRAVVPNKQHVSVFYGLAKAAGDTTAAASNNAVGTYTDTAKDKIQQMLGIDNLIAQHEDYATATNAISTNDLFIMSGKLYKATADIAANGTITPDTNCVEVSIDDAFVKKTNYVSEDGYGIARTNASFGVTASSGVLRISSASSAQIKAAESSYKPVTTGRQHEAVFYGLAKAAGDSTQAASENAVGTYTNDAKTAIRSMIGAVSRTDYGTNVAAGVVKWVSGKGVWINNGTLELAQATDNDIKSGTDSFRPIQPAKQHVAAFYGLAKAAGDTTQSQSENAVGTYTDSAKSAIRTMIGAIGSTNYATDSVGGVVKVLPSQGIGISDQDGTLYIQRASDYYIKTGSGTAWANPIVPMNQHTSVFYGLAKAAGDTTQAESSDAVGTYTSDAKSAIQTMLGVENGVSFVETVTGSTPTITGVANTRYVCGEVTSISITPPNAGTIIVRFTSGSTVAVLTLPNTVKMPEWFDATSLETNHIYELCIEDGVYGGVMAWPT